MELSSLPKSLPEYQKLLSAARNGRIASVYGVSPVHRAHLAAALCADLPQRTFCVILRDEAAARAFAEDLSSLGGPPAALLPCRDPVFHNVESLSHGYEQQRLAALSAVHTGRCRVLCAPADALMLHTLPPEKLEEARIPLEEGTALPVEELTRRLVLAGYTRCAQVEGPGQFALRGGILDVFPAGEDMPLRAEFFGDEVDSLSRFDPLTQRRTQRIPAALLLPVREALPQLAEGGAAGLAAALEKLAARKGCSEALRTNLRADAELLTQLPAFPAADRYLSLIYPRPATAFDYLPENTVFLCCDTPAVLECAQGAAHRQAEMLEHLLAEGILPPAKTGYSMDEKQFQGALSGAVLQLDSFLTASAFAPQVLIPFPARQLSAAGGGFENLARDVSDYLRLNYTVYLLAGGEARAQNLCRLLEEQELPFVRTVEQAAPRRVCVLPAGLSAGIEYPSLQIVILCEGPRSQRRPARRRRSSRDQIQSFSDLHPGDLVVHEHHGIGRFVGVERIQVDRVWRDYIKIAYAGTDFVFVPATALDLVSKYIGSAETETVRLAKLGTSAWQKAKQRAKKSASDLAEQLLKLYAARQKAEGYPFAPDDDWQRSFEEAFPYEETEDQLLCAQEIKKDMERPVPMDRLLCGDVGFGKTEVAFRAVMKCLLSNKQAAVLVPTTVLARQHYFSAVDRFSGYPVKVEVMSRLRTPKQLQEIARRVKAGQVDLLIGTHRILQKDIAFRDLGLLVVDEEQRFGVAHKERIKQMAQGVDVLTLTATPIPRTLNMALSGIRDMSVLEEAPLGRQPVQTFVLEQNDAVLRDAVRRELSRGGQVYYLHNRIEDIERTAARLQVEFPDAVVATAHGRMGEEEMGDVMSRFYQGEISILVCTTIIETGVDVPNVNTLIVEDADRMGLAQLHQLRGRVGRSSRHAYAYLTYRRGKALSEVSQKRLSAIREFAEFGSGFKIAMRDLEIRGAGNVLGAEQSGHMMDVGYDLYLQLLSEATAELRGEAPVRRTDCTADLLVSANLPQRYVSDAATRVDLYRRIAMISSEEDRQDMTDELIDRFGDPPAPVMALLDIALLRADASRAGVCEITQKNGALLLYFRAETLKRAAAVCAEPSLRGRIFLSAGDKPYITLKLRPADDPLARAKALIALYTAAES
ncbi:MAG: transcription-repair coupling factor [Clostridia bacterium]|nr:transcription-repair coupling factor [Clostridia bacterium]